MGAVAIAENREKNFAELGVSPPDVAANLQSAPLIYVRTREETEAWETLTRAFGVLPDEPPPSPPLPDLPGVQAWCATCEAADCLKRGLPRDKDGNGPALCLECWRRIAQRRRAKSKSEARLAARARSQARRVRDFGRRTRQALRHTQPHKKHRRRKNQPPRFGAPVWRLATGLLAIRARFGFSRRAQTRLWVFAATVVSGSFEAGRRARPGRADIAAILGWDESTITQSWADLVAMGLLHSECDAGRVSHNKLVAEGAVCVCGVIPDEAAEIRRQARLNGDEVCRWRNRREFTVLLLDHINAEDIGLETLEEAAQILTELADECDPQGDTARWGPKPKVAPPPTDDPTHDRPQKNSPAAPTVGGNRVGYVGASYLPYRTLLRPQATTSTKQPRRKTKRRLDRDAVDLSLALIDRSRCGQARVPQFRTGAVAIIASMLQARGLQHEHPSDIETFMRLRLDKARKSPPMKIEYLYAWLKAWLPQSLAQMHAGLNGDDIAPPPRKPSSRTPTRVMKPPHPDTKETVPTWRDLRCNVPPPRVAPPPAHDVN